MKKNEAISKYNIMGSYYVKLDELMALIREMQRKHRACTEPGYMHKNKEQSISADLALNHLSVVLNKEKITEQCLLKLFKTRIEREEREEREKMEKEPRGEYMVYKAGKKPKEYHVFIEWDNGVAVVGKDGGMVFDYKEMAQHVANRLGDGWKVIDVSQEECNKCERLLSAIFGDEPEYHGDGTKAEDEDWEGNEND